MTARRAFLIGLLLAAIAAVAYFFAFRSGAVPYRPAMFAAIVAVNAAGFAAEGLYTAIRFGRGALPGWIAVPRLLVAGGLVLVAAGGLANWLWSLQGFMVLAEGDVLPLFGGTHLQEYEAGPLADPDDIAVVIGLKKVDLLPAGDGGFYPRSDLEIARRGDDQDIKRVSVAGNRQAAYRSLRFHQGAFGFAPRLVVLRGDETVFDRTVPFTSMLEGPTGIRFVGRADVDSESLELDGSILLDNLDPAMKGHPELALSVVRDGDVLGSGTLLPGHFSDIGPDYRVGFAGLTMWSEIDVSRRNYRGAILAGSGVALVGLVAWPIGAVVARRRHR